MKYITRFAPSPTGKAHIGNIRTALFDFLAARSTGGRFLLRIEDTDRERFVPDAVDYIHDSLKWLGLKNDGEVVYQSEHLDIYQRYARKLLEKGHAYKCFCTSDRLEQLKHEQEKAGKPPLYDRQCLKLSREETMEREKKGDKFVIRFLIPEEPAKISWNDLVRDDVTFDTKTLEDFIILKSDGWPTYNLAHIVDDHEQGVNLVIRGEEFIPSTPKYILLHQALGWKYPEYAHMPLTVGKDRQKLSKRHGANAILDYKNKGYLPEAMVNFLVLLGWNPGGGSTEEIFSLEDLVKKFRMENVNKAAAVFDIERLNWMNGVWIRSLSAQELTSRLTEFDPHLKRINQDFLEKIVTVEQSRLKTLAEFGNISAFYLDLPKFKPNLLVFSKSSPEASKKGLKAVFELLSEFDWSKTDIPTFEAVLAKAVSTASLTSADIYWPVRAALSGQEKSPSPAELLWVLGQEESLKRLGQAIKML